MDWVRIIACMLLLNYHRLWYILYIGCWTLSVIHVQWRCNLQFRYRTDIISIISHCTPTYSDTFVSLGPDIIWWYRHFFTYFYNRKISRKRFTQTFVYWGLIFMNSNLLRIDFDVNQSLIYLGKFSSFLCVYWFYRWQYYLPRCCKQWSHLFICRWRHEVVITCNSQELSHRFDKDIHKMLLYTIPHFPNTPHDANYSHHNTVASFLSLFLRLP